MLHALLEGGDVAKLEERMATVARLDAAGETLEGIYLSGGPDAAAGAVIAPPHPLYGGSMDSPVTNELAWSCAKAGISSLRFNWRGVGASAGAPSGEAADADADYASALAHMAESVPGPLLAAGYSFGAAAAVRVARQEPRVRRLLLVAPPPSLIEPAEITAGGQRVLVLAGAHDAIAPAGALEASLSGASGARFVCIEEADHFFAAGLAEVGRAASSWLGAG